MPLFELTKTSINCLQRVDFADLDLLERRDLQRLLRDHISAISPTTLIIAEEFDNWDRSDRRIDLLGVDRQGRLVVIELKRTTDDSLADLQALRYASMVSRMTFEEAINTYSRYLARRQIEIDARKSLLKFLTWNESTDGPFAEDVRIVLAAADFNPEVTSTVLWLNERDLDITCVRIHPYRLGNAILLDVQQIIPLPEAADYQIQIRQKQREKRAVAEGADWTRYDLKVGSETRRALYKRNLMLETTKFLVGQGIHPDEIQSTVGRSIFECVDGTIDSVAFRTEIGRRRPNDSKVEKRYFSSDDQLFVVQGKTYALTTQWSKPTMEPAMAALMAKYGSLGLSYSVVGEP